MQRVKEVFHVYRNHWLAYAFFFNLVYLIFAFSLLMVYILCYEDISEEKITRQGLNKSFLRGHEAKFAKRNYSDLNFDFENKCFFESHLCFSFPRCYRVEHALDRKPRIKVHVYSNGLEKLNTGFSDEFIEFVQTILESDFYEPNPAKACLFVPLVDFLQGTSFGSRNISDELNALELLALLRISFFNWFIYLDC